MPTMTQETLQNIWHKYAARLDNDADSDVVRGDYYQEVSHLGGLAITGRGELDQQQADAVVNDLCRRGCTVLRDPARHEEDSAFVLFAPEKIGTGTAAA